MWAGTAIGDITLRASADRTDLFTIALLEIRDELLVSPFLTEVSNEGENINFKFLIFRGVGIIKSPLFKRDISANKAD